MSYLSPLGRGRRTLALPAVAAGVGVCEPSKVTEYFNTASLSHKMTRMSMQGAKAPCSACGTPSSDSSRRCISLPNGLKN